jgi:hypothetical protein
VTRGERPVEAPPAGICHETATIADM